MNRIFRLRKRFAVIANSIGLRLLTFARKLDGDFHVKYDIIPSNQYEYIPKGACIYGPADKYLLVPKNRYRAVLLPEQSISADYGIGWITEDNSSSSYDLLWGDEMNLTAFREEAEGIREKLSVEIVDFILDSIDEQSYILDVGCGVGDLLSEVRRHRPKASFFGLDFSQKAVEAASASFPDGCFLHHVIEQSLPYPSGSFDVVLCTDVLEHLERPKLIAAELVRICRPGGMVVIVVPDGDVDQFLGHYWFWNKDSLSLLLTEWEPEVIRLPMTREFLARIQVPMGREFQ